MRIILFGFTGSGKTTIAKIVAKKLGLKLVNPSFKDLAKKKGISLLELQRLAEKDKDIDIEFDNMLKEMLKEDNIVTANWLSPWFGEGLKIYLYASFEERVRRVMNRDNLSYEEAKEFVKEKDESNIRRYKELYGFDITSLDPFHLMINTMYFKPEKSANIICKLAEVVEWQQ